MVKYEGFLATNLIIYEKSKLTYLNLKEKENRQISIQYFAILFTNDFIFILTFQIAFLSKQENLVSYSYRRQKLLLFYQMERKYEYIYCDSSLSMPLLLKS